MNVYGACVSPTVQNIQMLSKLTGGPSVLANGIDEAEEIQDRLSAKINEAIEVEYIARDEFTGQPIGRRLPQ